MKLPLRFNWLPWKLIVRHVARSHGFLDPIAVMGHLRRFAQPSEVQEPIELLRAGVVLHARGLVNSRVIQHNLDWLWPYWVERQFDPADDAFVPRAFSITHINLTHRNWTAVGVPDCTHLPIVDPRGLLTPHLDGWSLDGWVVTDDGRFLSPSRMRDGTVQQRLDLGEPLAVETRIAGAGLTLDTRASADAAGDAPACLLRLDARADAPGWLVVALRPFNPEGVSFVHEIELRGDDLGWTVDGRPAIEFDTPVDRHRASHYRAGDVSIHLRDLEEATAVQCEVGMATAAAMFRLEPHRARAVTATVPLEGPSPPPASTPREAACELAIPDRHFQFLYEAARRTLVLHTPSADVYAGPYTYKRFWFRDAAFILQALLCTGQFERSRRVLDAFPSRQNPLGYFHSQDGEWDSNGEALWIMHRSCALTGRPLPAAWRKAVRRGAEWIVRKRLPDDGDEPHAGLLPPGFSAEHLGPNDYYYWDDFWGVAGLRAAAALTADDDRGTAERFRAEAEAFDAAVDRSLDGVAGRLRRRAMPASPYRRLDAGAIGSLAAGYPLSAYPPDDPRLLDTADFLLDRCLVNGAFFQDVIHSGINAYLTLHIAQVLLRAGRDDHFDLMRAVAAIASPTGQWPEAVHPRTGGGCMGDGQHAWAAAEWIMIVRNCFVREEGDRLILISGLPRAWLESGETLRFGPAPTEFGTVTVTVAPAADERLVVSWTPAWHGAAPIVEVRAAGHEPIVAAAETTSVELVGEAVP